MKPSTQSSGRLVLKSDFSAVRNEGRKQVSSLAIMLYAGPDPEKTDWNIPRCGVICSRKFDKRAVRRNRARRLLYEAFRLTRQELIPCRIIFIPRKPILERKMQDVVVQLERMYRKAGLFQTSRM